MFIELTRFDGLKIAINAEAIGWFVSCLVAPRSDAAKTEIFITGGTGGSVYVLETYAEVFKLLNPEPDF